MGTSSTSDEIYDHGECDCETDDDCDLCGDRIYDVSFARIDREISYRTKFVLVQTITLPFHN